MSAGDDHDVRTLGRTQSRRHRIEIVGDDLARIGKALAVGVGFAIVHDRDLEACGGRNLVEVVGDVPGAKDVEQRRRQHRLDEDLQRAAAHQAGIVLGIVVEIEGQRARLLFFHHLARRLPHFGFHAAAADGAGNRAVIAHQHLRRLERRNRAANVGDGRDRTPPSLAAQLHDLFVDVHEKKLLAISD